MVPVKQEMTRLSHTLVWRGLLIAILGASAVVFPELVLIPALLAVGAVAMLSGIYEISIAVSVRAHAARWRLVLSHGFASVTFGMLTMAVAAPKLRWALVATSAWLVFYASIAWRAAKVAPVKSRAGTAARALACLHAGLAFFTLYPAATIFGLLFLGGAYATAFGVWQFAVGVWLRRRPHVLTGECPTASLATANRNPRAI